MTSHPSDFARGTDPGTGSPAELEREARESRADVERTLDAIQDRLSPGQLVDQVARYMRDNGGEFARNFGDTVRQNPVPVVLVGVGLAWMMLGSRRDVDLPRAADADEYWAGNEAGSATARDDPGGDEGAAAYASAEVGTDVEGGIGERAWGRARARA